MRHILKVKVKSQDTVRDFLISLSLSLSLTHTHTHTHTHSMYIYIYIYICCILTFDLTKHAIPKTAEVHIPFAWASLADKMGQGKILRYSHRLMHRKRVTCELHNSYFRLMTIKDAIPKILSGRLNYYITRGRQEVS